MLLTRVISLTVVIVNLVPAVSSIVVSDIRLSDGFGPSDGRVELNVNGVWGTVCDVQFDIKDAEVICRMIGLTATWFFPKAWYGPGTGPMFASRLACTGRESDIGQCSFESASLCEHVQDVSVICTECGKLTIRGGTIKSVSTNGTVVRVKCIYSKLKIDSTCDANGTWTLPVIICDRCGRLKIYNGYIVYSSDDGYEVTVECKYSKVIINSTCEDNNRWTLPIIMCDSLNITDVQLTGGIGLFDGIVEFLVDDIWGAICLPNNRYLGTNEGQTICNMLGLSFYMSLEWKYYSGSSIFSHIADLHCKRIYGHINECVYRRKQSCHTFAVIQCEEYPLNITDIRLVDWDSPYAGRLELRHGDVWGTVCYKYIDERGADTFCHMLGLNVTKYYSSKGTLPILIGSLECGQVYSSINDCSRYYQPGIYMPDCDTSNQLLLICTHCGDIDEKYGVIISANDSVFTILCDEGHVPETYTAECLSNGTWLRDEYCVPYGYPLDITNITLADGVGLFDGRVEVYVNGTWGTICASSFGKEEAYAICNLTVGMPFYRDRSMHPYYNDGTGPIYLTDLECNGKESHINECRYLVNNTCTHSQDVAVICNGLPLNITNITLVNGTDENNGRVEIYANDVWGTVCNQDITVHDADALCKTMDSRLYTFYKTPFYHYGEGPVLLGDIRCPVGSNHLDDCTTHPPGRYKPDCSHDYDLSLSCTKARPRITGVRVNGTAGPYHGRIEVGIDNIWGTVCHDSFYVARADRACKRFGANCDYLFNIHEANVFCRLLGASRVKHIFYNAFYGEGPVRISLVDCQGTEQDINDCLFIYDNDCQHKDDVSIECYGPTLNITNATLVNGTGPYDGRIEIKVNDTWGTICDWNFGMNDADAFCNMLGLRALQYFTGATYGEGGGPVFIDSLECSASHTNIRHCPYLYQRACNHTRDVSVICSECGQTDIHYWDVGFFTYNGTTLYADCSYYKQYLGTLSMKCDTSTKTWKTEGRCRGYNYPLEVSAIQFVVGSEPNEGRVELKVMDVWGTVCSDKFGMNEANVICRMAGYVSALDYYVSVSNIRTVGPIFVDDLQCDPDGTHINDCTYITLDDCSHEDDVHVVCTDCGSTTPVNGNVNSSNSNVGASVMVWCNKGYRINGPSVVTCRSDGKWSASPTCVYIDCGDPTPDNGIVNTTATNNGTVVSASCNVGYNLIGASVIVCMENDSWTGSPKCQLVDCGYPDSGVNAEVSWTSTIKTTYKEFAVITCLTGYLPRGSFLIQCQADGQWEQSQQCEIIDCRDPVPYLGYSDTIYSTSYGAIVEIHCISGYDIMGSSTIACQEDGTWSDSPTCDSSDCGTPRIANSFIDRDDTTVGSEAEVTCYQGYSLLGSSTLECTEHGWTDTSCIKEDCGDPTPDNGYIMGSSSTLYGDILKVECNTRYELVNDSMIVCQADGIWSSKTSCKLIDCGLMLSPLNGNADHEDNTNYGATVTFTCNDGYLLVGEDSSVCGDYSQWSNAPPTCLKLSALGESCEADIYCQTEDALCMDSKCTCLTGVYDESIDKCDTMPLFPFGEDQTDDMIPKSELCMNTSFNMNVPVFDMAYSSAKICRDGFINLAENGMKKAQFPLENNRIIAPFFATTTISQPDSGNVWFRTYNAINDTSWDEHREEVELLENYVVSFSEMETYDALFVLIVTWENMKPENAVQLVTSKNVTFQLVLLSDGTSTFVFYIYGSSKMNWQNVKPSTIRIYVWAGYYFGSDVRYMISGSFMPDILKMDSYKTGGVNGLVFLESPVIENKEAQCIRWFKDNVARRYYTDLSASLMPECPCEIRLARWDPWFWHIRRRGYYVSDHICVDMRPGRHYDPFGKSCCYDRRSNLWIDERPFSGNFYRYNKQYAQKHYANDESPKDWCCSGDGTYCDLYYKLRPTGTCYRRTPYDLGNFWGDPHYRTLDGKRFTFNGLGEYTLIQLRTHTITFDLQARTDLYRSLNGTFSNATIFSAFAAMDDVGNSIHVEINNARSGINVFANKIELTTMYNAANDETTIYTSDDKKLVLSGGESLKAFFPSIDISLNISVSAGMLLLNVIVPTTLKNQTTGLLGNFNEEVSDDFILPNGTVLPETLSEREIFEYGQHWSIDPHYSAFNYPDGYNHTDYHISSHTPPFLDEVDDATISEAENVCYGAQNTECVFDLIFTGNDTVALETYRISEEIEQNVIEMSEETPYLMGCESIYVHIQTEVVCQISIDDDDGVYFLSNNVSAVYDTGSKSVKYFQSDDLPVELRFAAVNENGRLSVPFIVDILLCTGCTEHGECSGRPRKDGRETEHFKYAKCECFPQYTGLDCEEEYDWCSEQPCSLGRNCTTLTISEQTQFGIYYMCSTCPNGYYGTDIYNQACLDIDECSNNDLCDHTCINTYGSYICTCNSGYQVDQREPHTCKDIDECHDVEFLHNCSQQCVNIDGGFNCLCYNGFYFDTSTFDCASEIIDDDNPCKDKDCSQAKGCTYDENGNALCFCDHGYTLDSDQSTCIDEDECTENICTQECENSIGSFQCYCYSGYKLDSKTTCIECDEYHWGENCTNQCSCYHLGTDLCHPVKGCICHTGWGGELCDINVNECDTTVEVCDDAMKECIDTVGAYKCECIDGYTEMTDGHCQDLDECSNPFIHDCDHICINTYGSYSCECYAGYTKVGSECQNIDECSVNTDGCEHICIDYPGTHNCDCYSGYVLNDDRRTCSEDLCLSVKNITCSHFCISDGNDFVCGCQQGYFLGTDDVTCIDKNECSKSTLNQCDSEAECLNTALSYECVCPTGTQLNNDGRTCSECDSSHYGLGCQQTCTCVHGTCDSRIGCLCSTGWVGLNCDIDVDECSSGLLKCPQANRECVNIKGGAICGCKLGFKDINGICTDMNECEDTSTNDCDHLCINTLGRYHCSCYSGFILVDDTCTDIDECIGTHDCEQLCENKPGGYTCYCEAGFHINTNNRSLCLPNELCSDLEAIECGPHTMCYRVDGNRQCLCENGYSDLGGQCTDIDECEDIICSHTCSNSAGTFECGCYQGYQLDNDQMSCKVCDDWTFGSNCESVCSCNTANTETCDSINGTCTCKFGWTGDSCDTDIDECTNETTCTNHSTCMNVEDGYHCDCETGYVETAIGTCEECDRRHYGDKCRKECDCLIYNTDICDHVTGLCTCLEGWTGSRCHIDIDECENTNNCTDEPNTKCVNKNGYHTCNCIAGYFKQDGACIETDECLMGISVHGCTEICHNTEGGYRCACFDGTTDCIPSEDDEKPDANFYIIICVIGGVVALVIVALLVTLVKKMSPTHGVQSRRIERDSSTLTARDISLHEPTGRTLHIEAIIKDDFVV